METGKGLPSPKARETAPPPGDAGDFLQVFTTAESREEAQAIAAGLLERRLAGCVQVLGPVSSAYWWEGRIEAAEEWLCLIKTRSDLYGQVEQAIRELHTYDVPEILAMPVAMGSEDYLAWLGSVLRSRE